MNLSNDIEFYGDEILSFLGDSTFNGYLTDITAEKLSLNSRVIELIPFRKRGYGWIPNDPEVPSVYVMGLKEKIIEEGGGWQKLGYDYAIEACAAGDDSDALERITNRYARAIRQRLTIAYPNNSYISEATYSPTLKSPDGLYKLCSLQFRLRVLQDLT
jgi:hypothetical protein